MRKSILTICLACGLSFCFGQSVSVKSLVDSLRYLQADTLDCKAATYWKIISYGQEAIPYLIDNLSDTTHTNVWYRCKSTNLNVAEISYLALQEIAMLPVFNITHIQFDFFGRNNCWNFYDYFFNNANKQKFQHELREWYAKNKSKFKKKKILARSRNDCQRKYSIHKYLEWTGN